MYLEERGLTIDRLREVLRLDPETGDLYWKYRDLSSFKSERDCRAWNTRYAGTRAGHARRCNGYLYCVIDKRPFAAHRLVFALVHGRFPEEQIDHINGIKLDNRPSNLREVSNAENQRNAALPAANTSGALGVSWCKGSDKWMVRIRAQGKQIYLGLFSDFDEAVRVRKEADVKFGYHKNHGRKRHEFG